MGRRGPHGEYLASRKEILEWTAVFRKERDKNDEREAIHGLVADEFADDLDDSLLLAGGITNVDYQNTQWEDFDLHELAETTRRLRREAEDARQSMKAAIAQMEPCGVCGRRVRFWDGPPEAIFVCTCVRDRLRAASMPEADPTTLPFPLPSLYGISVEVYP